MRADLSLPSTRSSRAVRANLSLRAGRWCLVVTAVVAAAACGKKGPPLAPFVRVPAAVTAVTPVRAGDDVYLSFEVPSTNADGRKPATIGGLEVYAITSERAPETRKQRELATLIATIPVRPILPEPPPLPANASPPPEVPLPPGVDQGAKIAVRETLTPEAEVPVELPVEGKAVKPLVIAPRQLYEDEERVTPALVAPPLIEQPRRRYFVVGISPRGRESVPSSPVALPLERGSSAPGAPTITYTETDMMLSWSPPPDARTATFLLPPTVTPTDATPADVTPANATPPAPPPWPVLTVKSLGFNTQATTYQVFDVTPMPVNVSPDGVPLPPPPDDPFDVKVPTPLPPAAPLATSLHPVAPLPTDTEFLIRGVTFGVERCFQVRAVDLVFGASVLSPASPTTCISPQDTFPPAAPTSLAAIAGSGVISLIWDPNTEKDLAGYIVLRGEAPGDTLQAVTPEPISVTSFRDDTVKPGVRYVYAVVAVDTGQPQNVSPQSNRAEETARQ